MSRIRPFLPNLPDCDDTLRRLADVLLVPETCRKAMRSQSGYGPPCFFDRQRFFTRSVLDNMNIYREYWDEEREKVETALRPKW